MDEICGLVGKHIVNPKCLCPKEMLSLLWTAFELKTLLNQNCGHLDCVKGSNVTLLMERSSLYWQSLINCACSALKANLTVITDPEWCIKSQPSDVGKYLSLTSDVILCQTKKQMDVEQLAEHSNVPVVNVMSCRYVLPMALSNLMVMQAHFGHLDGLTLSWIGVPCPLLSTYMCTLPRLGLDLRYMCACCKEQLKSPLNLNEAISLCSTSKTTLKECHKVEDVLKGAHVIAVRNLEKTCELNLDNEMLEKYADGRFILLPIMPRCNSNYGGYGEQIVNNARCMAWKSARYSVFVYAAIITRLLAPYEHITPRPQFRKCCSD